tara:strand:+ start:16 stop:366 length:351 start_codon:yes stop_codon:yes gene_type:complete
MEEKRPTKRICTIPEVEKIDADFRADRISYEEYSKLMEPYTHRNAFVWVYEDATVEEFKRLTQGFDWHYQRSDDPRVYRKWSNRYAEIRKVAYSLGDFGQKLFDVWKKKNPNYSES